MKKKLLLLTLSAAMIAAMSGCGKKVDPVIEEPPIDEVVEVEKVETVEEPISDEEISAEEVKEDEQPVMEEEEDSLYDDPDLPVIDLTGIETFFEDKKPFKPTPGGYEVNFRSYVFNILDRPANCPAGMAVEYYMRSKITDPVYVNAVFNGEEPDSEAVREAYVDFDWYYEPVMNYDDPEAVPYLGSFEYQGRNVDVYMEGMNSMLECRDYNNPFVNAYGKEIYPNFTPESIELAGVSRYYYIIERYDESGEITCDVVRTWNLDDNWNLLYGPEKANIESAEELFLEIFE